MALKLARSRDEALLYLDLTPCERCGSIDVDWDTAVVAADGGLARSYHGTCQGCGLAREYLFALPEPGSVPLAGEQVIFGGERPSELLDAGEWLWVADLAASDVPVDDPEEARRTLSTAVAAVGEVLKFVPDGAAQPPDAAFWSERGQRVRAAEPGRFDRERLAVVRDTYRDQLAELDGPPPAAPTSAPAGPPAGPDRPLDVEGARRWLRETLLAVATAVYPETEPLVERDDGPLRSDPGPAGTPGGYSASVSVSTGASRPPWDAGQAVQRAGDELAARGWRLDERSETGDRHEVVARRAGFVAVAAMLGRQGILRLSGHTPTTLLAPDAPAPAGTDAADWAPANEVESALLAARRLGDEDAFLGLLRQVPLFLPAPDELELAESDEPVPFGTTTVDGVVHLVAFTSPDSLAHVLAEDAQSWLEITYPDLVRRWPDPTWRLAVDPGTPIETYLTVTAGTA
jgi:hypothetical protein